MFRRLKWKMILRAIFSIALIWWFAFSIEWQELYQALAGINLVWLSGAVAWIIIAVIVSVVKWQKILKAQNMELNLRELWRIYWAGLFFNNFLPSSIGGDAVRIIWVGKITGKADGAAASVIIERILATAGLALTGLVAGLLQPISRLEILVLFFILTIVSFFLLGVLMWGRLTVKEKDNRLVKFLKGMNQHGRLVRKNPRIIFSALMWSMVFQMCVVAVNICIFYGLNLTQISWINSMYVIPATSIAAMLPLGINGYGLREGTYISLLGVYGVSSSSAFAASIMFAFLVSICSLWGGWYWVRYRWKKDNEKEDNENVGIESV